MSEEPEDAEETGKPLWQKILWIIFAILMIVIGIYYIIKGMGKL